MQQWTEVWRRHHRLVLYLAGLFAWVWAVPLYGYATTMAAAGRTVDLTALFTWFLVAHAVGLVFSGYYLDRHPENSVHLARFVLVVDGLLTLLVWFLPPWTWLLWFMAMGVITAPGVTAWGRWYASTVETGQMGRVFGLAAAGVSLFQGGLELLSRHLSPNAALPLALLFLAIAWLAILGTTEFAVSVRRAYLNRRPLLGRIRAAARFGLFIVGFSVVAGLSYRFFLVVPVSPFVNGILRNAPYILGVLLAGVIVDRKGLPTIMVSGSGLLAAAFLIGAWGNYMAAAVVGIILNGLAFGLLESAPWLLLAANSTPETAGRWFGWGLNLNVVPILLGSVIGTLLVHVTPERLGLLAAVFLLLAILLLHGAADPLAVSHSDALESPAPPGKAEEPERSGAEGFELMFGGLLTDRELEIGKLVITGLSNRDIAQRMFISENTVKTHLKNIFRKTQSTNRHDLYRKVVASTGGTVLRDESLQS